MEAMRIVDVHWDSETERFTASGKAPEFVIGINAPRLDPGDPPTGFSPTELLLAGAGACAAWDVIGIMRKRRRPLVSLEVRVEGHQDDKPPHAYQRVGLHFTVSGDRLDQAEMQRVLKLSLDRYCSVLATIRPGAQIEESVEIVQAPAPSPAGNALTA